MKRVTVVVTLGKPDYTTSDMELRKLARLMMAAAHDECDSKDHDIVAIQSKISRKATVVKSL